MGIGNIATTGMQAAMTDMEVISNNIANAGTYAFKASTANFADLYPSGNNASSVQAGLGVTVTDIEQNFAPTGSSPTGSQSDLAINKNGFFVLTDPNSGTTSYTRNGHFSFQNGYLVSTTGARLQGFLSPDGKTIPQGGSPQDLLISTAPMPAKASTSITVPPGILNLNSNDTIPTTTPFNPSTQTSYNFSTTTPIYDSLGNTANITLYYVKTSANNWTVNAYVAGSPPTSLGVGSLTFNGSGTLVSQTGGLNALSYSPTTGATSPQVFNANLTNITQFGAPDSAGALQTDGFQSGQFSNYVVDENGVVSAEYSNKQSIIAGQVAIANFISPTGLNYEGNMSWGASSASGPANVSLNNSAGNIKQYNLELSNVDLANEMVNLVNAQNNFSANAQVEQVYSQVMQTVTKL